jgi:hypothetical protein
VRRRECISYEKRCICTSGGCRIDVSASTL